MAKPFNFINRLLAKSPGIYGPHWQKVQSKVWGRLAKTSSPRILSVVLEDGGQSFLVTLSEEYAGDISETWTFHVAGYDDYTATGAPLGD